MAGKRKKINFQEIIKNKKVHILTLDEKWHEMFRTCGKPIKIKMLESKVNDELKKQGRIKTEIEQSATLKKKLMGSIVNNMEATLENANPKAQKKMEETKRTIDELNTKIERLTESLYDIPKKLDEYNKKLLLESVLNFYSKMENNDKEIAKTDKYIQHLKAELEKTLEKRKVLEEENRLAYKYLHDTLGGNLIEDFDEKKED